MKEKIIFLFLFVFLLSYSGISEEKTGKKDIETTINQMEEVFGNTYYEAIFSLDELRPYSIIQINKIAEKYDNKWVSPSTFVSMLDKKDKKILTESTVEYICNLKDKQSQEDLINNIKLWCITENQLNLISRKIGIGRTNVLKIIMDFMPAPVNSNTGEIITVGRSGSNEEYYYYSTINQLSNLKQKELYNIFSRIFGELAQK